MYIPLALAGILMLAGGSYAYYREYTAARNANAQLASSTAMLHALQNTLASTTQERDALTAEQSKNQTFEGQISGTVGKLDQLSKTDPQLLAKYSKVYFLNENYVPAALSPIDPAFLFEPSRIVQAHAQIQSHLYDLLTAAQADGIDLLVASGYRSFGAQAALKSSYKVVYGAGTANAFSADQGYSEHQLGTAFDFTTKAIGGTFAGFEKSPTFPWLQEHAYRYGFILSYPKSNAYYQYEPWHWRYVGVDLATKLHDEGKNFYDLDQREINGYLISFYN
jgi:D-alanyl-D-alanine carboxypeptidase